MRTLGYPGEVLNYSPKLSFCPWGTSTLGWFSSILRRSSSEREGFNGSKLTRFQGQERKDDRTEGGEEAKRNTEGGGAVRGGGNLG